ncbi:hypothetical protein OEIGOIKO_08207 [Streptomyces chrestomyceticus JCM 4735]|uniref:Uncharacterized protein n=1 Tax=Streptomyces chrestomyceticus JCM 4735 TaxID=1306181 RepID=A0A7U9L3F9_9ACTN|nr:hypothetical protein OEIGOIKO_08207 [Streptomyces chrestomyceticus JCM 4735]
MAPQPPAEVVQGLLRADTIAASTALHTVISGPPTRSASLAARESHGAAPTPPVDYASTPPDRDIREKLVAAWHGRPGKHGFLLLDAARALGGAQGAGRGVLVRNLREPYSSTPHHHSSSRPHTTSKPAPTVLTPAIEETPHQKHRIHTTEPSPHHPTPTTPHHSRPPPHPRPHITWPPHNQPTTNLHLPFQHNTLAGHHGRGRRRGCRGRAVLGAAGTGARCQGKRRRRLAEDERQALGLVLPGCSPGATNCGPKPRWTHGATG